MPSSLAAEGRDHRSPLTPMSPEVNSVPGAHAWFCATGLPSDVVVVVSDVGFHLHRFPLMSKSKKLLKLITDKDETKEKCKEEEEEEEKLSISLPDLPGGAEAFEAAARFCYGVKIDLNPSTAVPIRCAAEHLEMTDDLSEDNLISRADSYISQSICRSVRDSVKALQSCIGLPAAEELGIVQRCVDAVAAMVADPLTEDSPLRKAVRSDSRCDDELTALSFPIFKRLISAMKARDLSSDVFERFLLAYARKSIPGLSRSDRKCSTPPAMSASEQIELLEVLIANLPMVKSAGSSSGNTRIFFAMLTISNIIQISEAARETLERKIGAQLELAVVDDLLMPSFSDAAETLYDVDCVERLLRYFLDREAEAEGEDGDGDLAAVSKLLDRYLSEIASDVNLKPERFCALAFALPERARLYDDGLYRAVDVYLKAHPQLPETEREKICGVMEYQKLTLEACTHAAQNERLPLRVIVQVLFFEQLQLRHAILGPIVASEAPESARTMATRDEQVLRMDMDSMRSRVQELERECCSMKKAIERMDRRSSDRSLTRRRFGCKFRTQVCDSHDRAIVDRTTRSRAEQLR